MALQTPSSKKRLSIRIAKNVFLQSISESLEKNRILKIEKNNLEHFPVTNKHGFSTIFQIGFTSFLIGFSMKPSKVSFLLSIWCVQILTPSVERLPWRRVFPVIYFWYTLFPVIVGIVEDISPMITVSFGNRELIR